MIKRVAFERDLSDKRVHRCLDEIDAPEMAVDQIEGCISVFEEDDFMPVGGVLGKVLRISQSGYSNFDVFDSIDQPLFDYYDQLFDRETDDYLPAVLEAVGDDVFDADIVIIHHMDLPPEHRHKGVGLAAVVEIARLFAKDNDLLVIWPAPMFSPDDAKQAAKLGLHEFVADRAIGTRKLASYFAQLGFEQVGKSEVWVRRAFDIPQLDEVFYDEDELGPDSDDDAQR
jgi:hypothetical protein